VSNLFRTLGVTGNSDVKQNLGGSSQLRRDIGDRFTITAVENPHGRTAAHGDEFGGDFDHRRGGPVADDQFRSAHHGDPPTRRDDRLDDPVQPRPRPPGWVQNHHGAATLTQG